MNHMRKIDWVNSDIWIQSFYKSRYLSIFIILIETTPPYYIGITDMFVENEWVDFSSFQPVQVNMKCCYLFIHWQILKLGSRSIETDKVNAP